MINKFSFTYLYTTKYYLSNYTIYIYYFNYYGTKFRSNLFIEAIYESVYSKLVLVKLTDY